MGIGRRNFLKLAGVSACAPMRLYDALAAGSRRLAMVVDLKKCRETKDCDLCIQACHRAHNVPDFGNPKDEIKWVWKEPFGTAFPDEAHEAQNEALKSGPALLLCNHCDVPPCVGVCPTQATWKREKDGVVMMDWHRCIGCRYCIAACPYGSRSFNWRDPRPFIREITPAFPTRTRGVVEKCNFCEERLAKGELPACVKACPAGAMAFGDLRDPASLPRQWLRANTSIRRKASLGTQPQVFYIV
jgi:Fe-S-cluster-containing dehydrogenase component